MIRKATQADTERLLEMSVRFMVETIYARIAPPSIPTLLQLIAVVLEKGVVFVDETPHANDCASWTPAVDFNVDEPPEPAPCNCHPEIVGMIAIAALAHILTGKNYGDEIVWWVEPEHRKSRAGYRLLCAAIEWARQNGLSVLKMVAPAGSSVGRFYEHLGFEAVETAYQLVITD